jgi:ornithine cyclodeaminase
LINALKEMFVRGCESPERDHFSVGKDGKTLLVMCAWEKDRNIGTKLVTIFPSNRKLSLPSVFGVYILIDGETGQPKAILDGGELTARRTAATSALAASYLARKDASTFTMVGTGRLSRNLIEAHTSVRQYKKMWVWGRRYERAQDVAEQCAKIGLPVIAAEDLETVVRQSDVISCATLSHEPLVKGDWLRPGTHVDLVGAFKPTMRETDAEVWRRTSWAIVDTHEGAASDAGDLIQAEADGVPAFRRVVGDLATLLRAGCSGRIDAGDITVFKSVGASIEDLAAASFIAAQHEVQTASEMKSAPIPRAAGRPT